MTSSWSVKYSCPEWKDTEEGLTEKEARKRYEAYCHKPPVRGGKMVKVVTLYDEEGKNVAGFATGGYYGKVE